MLDVALFFVICYIYNTRFCTIIETEEYKEEEENEGSCFRRVVDDVCVDFDDSLFFSLLLIYFRCTLLLITTSSVPRCALATP